ncbi:MAG: glycosyltransferase family 39 protein [Chloroflexi bacterium]|nr:glycosyltransferase family 39 protein [Chloroflexota bacterium]
MIAPNKVKLSWVLNRDAAYTLGIVLAVVITFALRASGAIFGYLSVDDGAFVSIAHGMNQGHLMYRDLVDHKPPGIELFIAPLLALSQNSIPLVRLTYVAVISLTCIPIAFLAQQVGYRLAGLVAAFFFAFDPTGIALSQYLTQTGLMVAILTWSTWVFTVAQVKSSKLLWLLSGTLAGAAFIVKQPAILLLGVYALFLLVVVLRSAKGRAPVRPGQALIALSTLSCGILLIYAPVLAYFWLNGALRDYILYVFGVNGLGVSVVSSKISGMADFLMGEPALFMGFLALLMPLFSKSTTRRSVTLLMSLWLCVYTIFLLLYDKLYDHYFLQMVPQLAVLGGIGAAELVAWLNRYHKQVVNTLRPTAQTSRAFSLMSPGFTTALTARKCASLVLIVVLASIGVSLTTMDTRNLLSSISAWESMPKLSEDVTVADRIAAVTSTGDKILIFGNPAFYALAEREPSSKYLYYSWRYIDSAIGPEYIQNLKQSLLNGSTRLVVVADAYVPDLDPQLLKVIDRNYVEVETVPYSYHGAVRLYKKRGD